MDPVALTIYASDQSLLHVQLEYETPLPEQLDASHRIAVEVVRATEAFAGNWLRPLGAGFSVIYRDLNNFFERMNNSDTEGRVLVRDRDIPAEVVVNPAVSRYTTEIVPRVESAHIASALHAAIRRAAAVSPAGTVAGLEILWWTAVEARSPDPEPLLLAVQGNHLMTPISRLEGDALWYLGPSGIAGPPVRIVVTSTHWIVTLEISVFWELWISNPAGRAMIDAGIERVLARGWTRA